MKTRYVVHHGFYHTFSGDTQPTWITRENADECARISAADREHLAATGVITAIEDAPSATDAPFLSAPAPQPAEPAHAHANARKRKGGD